MRCALTRKKMPFVNRNEPVHNFLRRKHNNDVNLKLEFHNLQAMKSIVNKLQQFERWFNNKFGWFFTNGMKSIENQNLN